MMEKNLKFINLKYLPDKRLLIISGDNKYVNGEIVISYRYLNSVFCFISRELENETKMKKLKKIKVPNNFIQTVTEKVPVNNWWLVVKAIVFTTR